MNSIVDIFYKEIVSKHLPINYVLNKYFKNDPKGWKYFLYIYELWVQVHDGYNEIMTRQMTLNSLISLKEDLKRFEETYKSLQETIAKLEDPMSYSDFRDRMFVSIYKNKENRRFTTTKGKINKNEYCFGFDKTYYFGPKGPSLVAGYINDNGDFSRSNYVNLTGDLYSYLDKIVKKAKNGLLTQKELTEAIQKYQTELTDRIAYNQAKMLESEDFLALSILKIF